ncbi:MAG TPA: hypothetical protein DGH68_02510 [Bacteroidetes bacterium]|jgi:hypothetical protein|nr:hypothetical protein [Bacteroidota bacterium]
MVDVVMLEHLDQFAGRCYIHVAHVLKQHVAAVGTADPELMIIIENRNEVMNLSDRAAARIVIF